MGIHTQSKLLRGCTNKVSVKTKTTWDPSIILNIKPRATPPEMAAPREWPVTITLHPWHGTKALDTLAITWARTPLHALNVPACTWVRVPLGVV